MRDEGCGEVCGVSVSGSRCVCVCVCVYLCVFVRDRGVGGYRASVDSARGTRVVGRRLEAPDPAAGLCSPRRKSGSCERDIFIGNLLVRVHWIIEMIVVERFL